MLHPFILYDENRVFWLNIAENRVYLWYRYCLKLFNKLRREANWGNEVAEILTKKDGKGERNDVIVGVRKELNFGNEDPFDRILSPQIDEVPKREVLERKRKKKIVTIKLSKFKGGERKKDYGNQVAENGMKKKKEFWSEVSEWRFH